MKIFKRVGMGLAALASMWLLVAFLLPGKLFADSTTSGPTKIVVGNVTYTAGWIDRSNIQISATNKAGKTTTTRLTDKVWDSNWEYTANTAPPSSTCGSMTMNNFGNAIVGMTPQIKYSSSASWSSSDSYGRLTVEDSSCSKIIDNQPIRIASWENASTSFKATASDTIQIVDQAQSLTFSNPRLQSDGTVRYYQDGVWGDSCQRIIAVNFNDKTVDQYFSAHQMEYADQTKNGTSKSFVDSNCQVTYTQSARPTHGSEDNATISNYSYPLGNFSALKKPSSVQDGNGTAASATGTTTADVNANCVNNSNSSGLEWLLCPITTSMEKAGDWFNGKIENQLNFDIKDNLPSDGPVHLTWSVIKNISSGLIVVLLLIMVIAQAAGGGPFEAYTIRKMLPKLVAAVIAMQLSWPICVWLIGLANDFGHGIGSLIAVPFGGVDAISLNHILKLLGWGGASQGILPIAFLGLSIAAIVALPTTFVILFGLIMGLIAAFLVLLFRNVLIIALTIFSPLAFLAWTMSGTESLWKTWKDNFMKLLAMFPLVIAIIYVGRAFAWIIANQGGTHGAFDYLTILVAFFGPYFVIFKAYKWGGGMLSAAGSGIAQARQGAIKAATPELQKLGQRAQGAIANKYRLAPETMRKAREKVDATDKRISDLQKAIETRKKAGKSTAAEEATLATLRTQREAENAEFLAAQKKNGRFRRAAYRIGSGSVLPTKRSQLETLAKGDTYFKELEELDRARMMHDYVEQLNAGQSVSAAKAYIRDKYAGSTDSTTQRAFHNWLIDTKSAKELGDVNWRTANGTMADIAKTPGFLGALNADPNRFAYIAQNLPELVPYNQAIGGGAKAVDFMPGGKSFAKLDAATQAKITSAPAAQRQQLTELLAEDARHTSILRNLEHSSDIAAWRPEQLKIMAENIQKLKAAGVSSSQAEQELSGILTELKQSDTPEARSTLQRLLGGKESARGAVNAVMGDSWLEDTLNIPVEVGGVARVAALPRDVQQFQEDVMSPPKRDRSGRIIPNKSAEEIARALAEDDDYSRTAHGRPRDALQANFVQVRDAVAASQNKDAIDQINVAVIAAIANVNERAQRQIRGLTTRVPPLTPTALAAERTRIITDAETRRAELEPLSITPLPPDADPTRTLKVPHTP